MNSWYNPSEGLEEPMYGLKSSEIIAPVSTLIAIIAFLRPEITLLVSRALGRLDVHINPRIEIGFSDYGPTLGIIGMVRSIKR